MDNYGQDIVKLRQKVGISLRELCRRADMSPAALSAIENGLSSPTLATMEKILKALGTSFANFFAASGDADNANVFRALNMSSVSDANRTYTLLFPKREDLKFEIISEIISPAEKEPEWEKHDFDLGGTILQGGPVRLEIEGEGAWELNEGDAYYIKAGQRHRATNMGDSPVKQVTVACPPKF